GCLLPSPPLVEIHKRRGVAECFRLVFHVSEHVQFVQWDNFEHWPEPGEQPEPYLQRLCIGQRDAIFGEQLLEIFEPISGNHAPTIRTSASAGETGFLAASGNFLRLGNPASRSHAEVNEEQRRFPRSRLNLPPPTPGADPGVPERP